MTQGGRPTTADRVRYVVSSNFTLTVAACLALVLVGAYIAVGTHSGPDTTTEQRTVATWSSDAEFRHGAVVQRDTRAFPAGTVLRNRSLYFASVAPVLNGSYVYRHEGGVEPAAVRTELRLIVRSIRQSGDETDVLWRVSEPIATRETESLDPGEAHRVPFEVNVTEQSEIAREVEADLGASPGRTQVLVVAETTAEVTVAGESVAESRSDRLEIAPRQQTYSVTETVEDGASERVTETVEVPTGTDPLRAYGSIAVALLGLCAAAVLAWATRTGRLTVSDATRTAIRRQRERESFEEWLSVGRVPPPGEDERVVAVGSLEDLVDVAIDSDRRVIEDPNSGAFAVLDSETRYVFDPDSTVAGGSNESRGPADRSDVEQNVAESDNADPDDAEPGGTGDPLISGDDA